MAYMMIGVGIVCIGVGAWMVHPALGLVLMGLTLWGAGAVCMSLDAMKKIDNNQDLRG